MIALIDSMTFIVLIISIIIVLVRWHNVHPFDIKLLTLCLLLFNSFYALLLFIEWDNISKSYDKLEDIIGALIPMFWAFLFYSFIQNTKAKELKQSEEFRKRIFESSKVPIVIMDARTNKYIDCNDAVVALYSFSSKQETIGKTPLDVSDVLQYDGSKSEVKAQYYLEKALNDGFIQFEWRHKRPNGEIWDADVNLMSFVSENTCFYQFTLHDITEKKRNENELKEYRNKLEQLVKERTEELDTTVEELHSVNEEIYEQKEELEIAIEALQATQYQLIQSEKMASLGLLSAGIAHEINNPLNFIHGGILGIEDYLNDNAKNHVEKLKPLIDAINIGVIRAAEIVTSLSHYSRKDELAFVECDIHSIIDNCLIMLQNQLKNKVEVKRKYCNNLQSIFANEGKLHQAILNIISNAEQSIEKNGIITIETQTNDTNLILKISDTGTGISEENLQKIYDPFFTTKAPGKGTGLGLSITFNIIKEHNGTILFESELHKGTIAIITLPITPKK
jgi:PAS domain S-box-containing protein